MDARNLGRLGLDSRGEFLCASGAMTLSFMPITEKVGDTELQPRFRSYSVGFMAYRLANTGPFAGPEPEQE